MLVCELNLLCSPTCSHISAGGKVFATTKSTLLQYRGSLLESIVTSDKSRLENGEYVHIPLLFTFISFFINLILIYFHIYFYLIIYSNESAGTS